MRFKFWVLSILVVFLTVLLGMEPGRTQIPITPPPGRMRDAPTARPQFPTSPPAGPVVPADWAEERFRQLDRDSDGYLSFDEMTENLQVEKDRWDANKDGRIDLDEWRAYLMAYIESHRRSAARAGNRARHPSQGPRTLHRARESQGPAAPGPPAPGPPAVRPPFDEGRLPGAMGQRNRKKGSSPHKFPSNMPAWFKEYDADGDGQVALYEWRAKENNVREFRKYDLNGDGVITVDELIRSGQFLTGTPRTPQVLNGLRAEVGEFFYFEVTGGTRGPIWGTDVYTIDSLIATAAVHSGVLRPGQTRLVKVTILSGQDQYLGSTRNGVTTHDYGPFGGSFRVELAPQPPHYQED